MKKICSGKFDIVVGTHFVRWRIDFSGAPTASSHVVGLKPDPVEPSDEG